MNIFQTIWNAISTPNETLINISGLFLCFIEVYVNMCLFTTLLNINASKRNKIIYVVALSTVAFLLRIFLPDPYGTIINMVYGILLIKFVLKASILKSIFAEFIPIFIMSALELFLLKFYLKIFNIPYDYVMTIPLHRVCFALFIYLCIFLLYKLIKYVKFNINIDILSKKNKILFIVSAILGLCVIATQLYLISYYSDTLPVIITLVDIIGLASYFFLSLYSMLNVAKLELTTRDLEVQQWHNKELQDMHDNLRTFKHDFNNIIQSIGGYLDKDDMEGLRKYYKGLLADCKIIVNLAALDPNVINSPSIYNILSSKYYKANENGITMNIESFLNLTEIEDNMKIYEFIRMFGILLDNAIEAAKECEKKEINVYFRKELNRHRLVVIVENTYTNKDVDIDKIYEKNYTSKNDKENHGLGLYEVRKILSRNNNLNLFTTKNSEYFKQQLEIYY